MVTLDSFDAADAELVASWAGDSTSALRWCSRPVVTTDVVAAWSNDPDVQAFSLRDGSQVVGYGELWVDDAEREVELARLIVAPRRRGEGLGRRLTELLTERARRHHPEVAMRVHPDNDVAIATYASAGFERADPADEAVWNVGQPVPYVWMNAVPPLPPDGGR